MPPWVSCPSYAIDLGRPLAERFDVLDPEMMRRGRELLAAEAPAIHCLGVRAFVTGDGFCLRPGGPTRS